MVAEANPSTKVLSPKKTSVIPSLHRDGRSALRGDVLSSFYSDRRLAGASPERSEQTSSGKLGKSLLPESCVGHMMASSEVESF
jgi:hypothetical protein